MLVAFMLETVTAFAPVILQALPAATPVSVSVPEPPVRFVIPENVVVAFSVPAFPPVTCQALVPLVAANVSVPPPPVIEPLKVSTPEASVNVSVVLPPTKF